jgi:hypothetical protein
MSTQAIRRALEWMISIDTGGKAPLARAALAEVEAIEMMARELLHLVRLLEPKEKDGGLDVPGLATLNGAREALRKAEALP